jgi:hypothetical protein
VGGWIKLEKDLRDDVRVRRMAAKLVRDGNATALQGVTLVLGGLYQLWSHADSFAREDDTLDITVNEIDELTCVQGFAQALPADWLEVLDENTVKLPGFQAHNGSEAKRRALTAKRVTHHRIQHKRSSVTPRNASALPDQTRPDQIRPDQKEGEGARSAPTPRASRRCPKDWSPSPETRASMATQHPTVNLVAELDKFRDHTFQTARSDWEATFRNWIRRCAEMPGGRSPVKADKTTWQPKEETDGPRT